MEQESHISHCPIDIIPFVSSVLLFHKLTNKKVIVSFPAALLLKKIIKKAIASVLEIQHAGLFKRKRYNFRTVPLSKKTRKPTPPPFRTEFYLEQIILFISIQQVYCSRQRSQLQSEDTQEHVSLCLTGCKDVSLMPPLLAD